MVYILLGEGFEEVEALCAADVLRRGGVEVTTTGLDRRTVVGSHGIPVTADAVAADVATAGAFNLTGTPSVIVDGKVVSNPTLANIRTAIRNAAN